MATKERVKVRPSVILRGRTASTECDEGIRCEAAFFCHAAAALAPEPVEPSTRPRRHQGAKKCQGFLLEQPEPPLRTVRRNGRLVRCCCVWLVGCHSVSRLLIVCYEGMKMSPSRVSWVALTPGSVNRGATSPTAGVEARVPIVTVVVTLVRSTKIGHNSKR